jgi:hypothetical protein
MMPTARPWAAAAATAALALLLVAASATAAPKKPVPIAKQKVTLVRQVSKLDGQYTSLRARVKTCASAAADLRVADKQRKDARRAATVRRKLPVLRAKRVKMAAAVLRLSRRAKFCASAAAPPTTSVAAASTPDVRLPDVLAGAAIDLSDILGAVPLGDVIRIVDISELGGLLCSATVTCIGIDGGLLTGAVQQLLANNLVASVLNLDVPGVLASLTGLLSAGDLTSLIGVQRISDTVLRLVPLGPLALLSGLPSIPNLPIGTIVP